MLRKITPVLFYVLIASHNWCQSAEYIASAVGAALSPNVTEGIKGVLVTARSQIESPKTFDNEYNEAVCGLNRDKMRKCMIKALDEFDTQASQATILPAEAGLDAHFKNEILVLLARNAEHLVLKHELALISIDYTESCKNLILDQINKLTMSLNTPINPRILGDRTAQELDRSKQERVEKAVGVLIIWKDNLLAALHEKYPYTSEGGIKDRYIRSTNRHSERGKEWGLKPDWFGCVAVPKMNLQVTLPFAETDENPEAKIVADIYKKYQSTFELVRTSLEEQISSDGWRYIDERREHFRSLFPAKVLSPSDYVKPKILVDYEKFLAMKSD